VFVLLGTFGIPQPQLATLTARVLATLQELVAQLLVLVSRALLGIVHRSLALLSVVTLLIAMVLLVPPSVVVPRVILGVDSNA